jgi:hypothetical protein
MFSKGASLRLDFTFPASAHRDIITAAVQLSAFSFRKAGIEDKTVYKHRPLKIATSHRKRPEIRDASNPSTKPISSLLVPIL